MSSSNDNSDKIIKVLHGLIAQQKSTEIRILSLHYQLQAMVETIWSQLMEVSNVDKKALATALLIATAKKYQILLESHEDLDPAMAADLEANPPVFQVMLNRYLTS